MSRRLDHTVEVDVPAEKIYLDLTNRDYWEAVMKAYRKVTPRQEITGFHCDDTGTHIEFTQTVPLDLLPPIARKLVSVDAHIVITREQHFEPYDHVKSRARGTYGASVHAAPAHFGGTYLLTETDTGSQLHFASVCKVRIPLIGGKLEHLILSHITKLFDGEEAFRADWISQHH